MTRPKKSRIKIVHIKTYYHHTDNFSNKNPMIIESKSDLKTIIDHSLKKPTLQIFQTLSDVKCSVNE